MRISYDKNELNNPPHERSKLVVKKALADFKCQGNALLPLTVNQTLEIFGRYNNFIAITLQNNPAFALLGKIAAMLAQYGEQSCFSNKWPGALDPHISLGRIRLLSSKREGRTIDEEQQEVQKRLTSNPAIAQQIKAIINKTNVQSAPLKLDALFMQLGSKGEKSYFNF